jgi:hypothetical protein
MERSSLNINPQNKCGRISIQNQNKGRCSASFGDVMGIPADYNDDNYRKDVVTIPPVSLMLPIPRAKEASQECVGENLIGPRGKHRNEQRPVHSNWTATRPTEEHLDAGV